MLCFRKAPADLENISISRSYGSAPNCILLSLFQIPPSASHISHRLIKTRLTKLAPPTNPIRDLQKTGPGSSAQNRKVTKSQFGTTNNKKALHHDSGLLQAAIHEQAQSPEHHSEGSGDQLKINSVSSQFKYR